MDRSAIERWFKRRWIGGVAIIAVMLLGVFAAAVPAHSADLRFPPYAHPYMPGPPSYEGVAYRPPCCLPPPPCCLPPPCCRPPPCCQPHVVERRWIEHEFVERRIGCCGPSF